MTSAYGAAALANECAELTGAIPGGRNDRLYRAARAIGGLVAAGEIDRGEAERALFDAAASCRYIADEGANAARSTIKSGLDRGRLKPREGKHQHARRISPEAEREREHRRVEAEHEAERARREAEAEAESRRALARRLWSMRRPIAGTIAETYLRRARGYGGAIPATLGFLPARGEHGPALIAAFGMATEPEPGVLAITDAVVMAVQLIKLKHDGTGKADIEPNKITIGKGALGSPIVLAPPNDLLGLAIAEGLENALSVHEATGLGAWASGGASRLPALADAVPDCVECVSILAHDDDAGLRHAADLAAHLYARGLETILKFLSMESTR